MRISLRRIVCSAILAAPFALVNSLAQSGHQAPPAPPGIPKSSTLAQTSSGVETAWDARKIIDTAEKANQQLKPVLSSLRPQEWSDKSGAPGGYVIQWQTAQQEAMDVDVTAQRFSQKTDSLPLGLDFYYRMEALEWTARSLDEGAKKYADPVLASKLTLLLGTNFDNRQHLRDYLRDLAADQEQNFKIADAEAQRCRGMISKEPVPPNNRKSKSN